MADRFKSEHEAFKHETRAYSDNTQEEWEYWINVEPDLTNIKRIIEKQGFVRSE
jgi:hypothetical protein